MRKINDLETRLESIESLLRLTLVNNVISNLGENSNFIGNEANKTIRQDEIFENELEILNDLDIKKFEIYSNDGNRFVIILGCDEFELNYIRKINKIFKKSCKGIVPVFYFNKLVGIRKSKISAEKISYMVAGKEMNINLAADKSRKK